MNSNYELLRNKEMSISNIVVIAVVTLIISLLFNIASNSELQLKTDSVNQIGNYDLELPLRIEAEYRETLRDIWNGMVLNDSRSFDELFDKPHDREIMTADDRECISKAFRDAQQRTLWERITNTNHEDVTFYKGLLEEYTRELLFCMKIDFIEEIN